MERKITFSQKPIKIDNTDRKIISALSENARLSFSQIARKIRVSKYKVIGRIKRLEEKKIILGYQSYVNPFKINLRLGFLLIKTNEPQLKIISYLEKCSKIKFVTSVKQIIGDFNIMISFYFINDEERDELIEKTLSTIRINDWDLLEAEKALFPLFDLSNIKKDYHFNFRKDIKAEIDEKDLRILQILSDNCRKQIINFNVGLNSSTIISRIKKLENFKIIEKNQPTLNFFALGYSPYLLKLKIINQTEKEKIIKFIAETKLANAIYLSKSGWNLLAFMHFKETKDLQNFELELMNKFNNIISSHAFEIINLQTKLDFFPEEIYERLKQNINSENNNKRKRYIKELSLSQ